MASQRHTRASHEEIAHRRRLVEPLFAALSDGTANSGDAGDDDHEPIGPPSLAARLWAAALGGLTAWALWYAAHAFTTG